MTADQELRLNKAVSEVNLWIADNYPAPTPIRLLYNVAKTILFESQHNPFTDHWKESE